MQSNRILTNVLHIHGYCIIFAAIVITRVLILGIMKLYHGSISIIDKPELGKGNLKNDYGLGL